MSKRLAPKTNIYQIQKQPGVGSSVAQINNSYLHQGYQSYLETTVSLCYQCKSSGNSALMSVCDCQDGLFHDKCLREWLKYKIDNQKIDIKVQNNSNYIKCENCSYDIKFKYTQQARTRSCQQVQQYCSTHKAVTIGIILTIMLIIGCTTYIALLLFNIIPMCECNLQKSVLMIALGVIGGVLLLVQVCCCVDCLRKSESKIETMYSRQGKSHRSSRSHRSRYSPSARSKSKIVVQSFE